MAFTEEAAAAKETTKSDAGGTWYEGKNEDGYSYYWNDVTGGKLRNSRGWLKL